MKVLLVEDDAAIGSTVVRALERERLTVRWERSGAGAISALPTDAWDVVLLDIGLPDMDGRDVCRRVRRQSEVPMIILSALGEETDRVVGLELGADDYMVKPVGLLELTARIRAVTRRRAADDTGPIVPQGQDRLTVGPLTLDHRSRRTSLAGCELELTPKEFDVLAVLMADPGAAVSRQSLLERVWGGHWYGPTKTLDVHVAALRRKLGDPSWIAAVRGVGFRLEAPSEFAGASPGFAVPLPVQ